MNTERNPENTRLKILKAAFHEIHKHGYQGMRIDQVLKNTGLKKGALYHHFASKQTLGYAVLEELIQKRIIELWIEPLKHFANPLEGIYSLFESVGHSWDDDFFKLGCPLNNLAQEMSPIDEGFRQRIRNFFQFWQAGISDALIKGQQQGFVSPVINTDESALFILSSLEGAIGMAKNHQSKEVFFLCGKQLHHYLSTLTAQ